MKLSKRRLKSLLLAEKVARELRYQLTIPAYQFDLKPCAEHLHRWMKHAGKQKYIRPKEVKP